MLQVGIFAAVAVAALVLLKVGFDLWKPGRGRIRRRLSGEFAPGAELEARTLYKDLDKWEADLDAGGAAAEPEADTTAAASAGWREHGEELLRQAGLKITLRQAVTGTAGLALLLAVLGLTLVGPVVGIVGAAAGVAGPVVALNVRRNMVRNRYVKQLVGAFELIARVLRAGQSVPEAFRAAVDGFGEPLSGEFARCLHQIEHGLRPEDAYRELCQRSSILELRIFVVTMAIQRQTGGNLSEMLDRLAAVIRARVQLRQKIRALTAEGRLQALTLTLLPLGTFVAMYALNRPYAESLFNHPGLIAGTIGCMTFGTLWIRSIMKFEG